MYKLLLLILLPFGTLHGQSKTSWKVYELFSNADIPLRTNDIQKYLPGYSILNIQTNPKKSGLYAIIDNNAQVNGLVFSTPNATADKMTRLVIPTPKSNPELMQAYLEDRAYRLTNQQKMQLLDLISQFSMDNFSAWKKSQSHPMATSSPDCQKKLAKGPLVFS